MSAAARIKLIAIAATGSDCIDLNYCRVRGIAVCNVRGYAANSVPEHVLMMVLALRRNLLQYREDVRRGLPIPGNNGAFTIAMELLIGNGRA